MSCYRQSLMIGLACTLVLGCNRPIDQPQPSLQKYRFLGIHEDESSKEGPVGLIGGQAIQVANISKVQEVPYSEYKRAVEDSKVVAQQNSMRDSFTGRLRSSEMCYSRTAPLGLLSWRDSNLGWNDDASGGCQSAELQRTHGIRYGTV